MRRYTAPLTLTAALGLGLSTALAANCGEHEKILEVKAQMIAISERADHIANTTGFSAISQLATGIKNTADAVFVELEDVLTS